MGISKFHNGVAAIRESKKPISKAWQLSFELLKLDEKLLKVMEILGDHENLFINKNPYHNHYHLAEVVWTAAYFADKEISKNEEKYFESMVVLLFAATFHDAGHLGRSNKTPFELETLSVDFFKNWWKNNSLFVENIVALSPIQFEHLVCELILFTEFTEGQIKVTKDYLDKKDAEAFGIKVNRLKKILNESDFLFNCSPHYAFEKTSLIVKETVRLADDEKKWMLILEMLEHMQNNVFISDAAKELKVESTIKKFLAFLVENKEEMKDGEYLQNIAQEKFKPTI
jgi:hypothetical protein